MKVLILHGLEGYAGIHWQGWLREQLLAKGYEVFMPQLPNPNIPERGAWMEAVNQALAGVLGQELIIVGHSLGAASAMDYIELHQGKIKGFVSVSGFHRNYDAEATDKFMTDRMINIEKVKANVEKVAVIYGDTDPYVPQEALQRLAADLGVAPEIVPGGGHLNSEAGFVTFPRLLEIIEEISGNKVDN